MPRDVEPGRFYVRSRPGGPLNQVGPGGVPDVVICRRVEDFPGGVVPAGGTVTACRACRRPVGHNAATFPDVPRICMQCADIAPEPFPQ